MLYAKAAQRYKKNINVGNDKSRNSNENLVCFDKSVHF